MDKFLYLLSLIKSVVVKKKDRECFTLSVFFLSVGIVFYFQFTKLSLITRHISPAVFFNFYRIKFVRDFKEQ